MADPEVECLSSILDVQSASQKIGQEVQWFGHTLTDFVHRKADFRSCRSDILQTSSVNFINLLISHVIDFDVRLAANWPSVMQIVRLISQDHMNNKQYVGKADFLVFRAMNLHGFLVQLQEKKLCAVIQLPSQTLLLSVSDKAFRLIGMLFPGLVSQGQVSSQGTTNIGGGGFMS
ncbi:hypothetical protein V8G54_015918 [Vigna mungo]|uniref:Uncharacterized protein n=1 Tax=Vigna mungo TaxID=3915 RepID=A0AAQ3RZY5_VIGMU